MVSMGNVWDRTAEFLSDNLGTVLPVALAAMFVPTAISTSFAELRVGASPGLGTTLMLASLLLAMVSFWGQLAITAFALDSTSGRDANRLATRRFLPGLLVMVVLLLGALVLVMPFGVILALNGVDLTAMQSGTTPDIPANAAKSILVYGLVLLPVMLWAFSRLAVVLPVFVGEGLLLGALPRSWRLTKGTALKIVGVVILYVLVAGVATQAVTFAFGAIMHLVAGSAGGGLSLASVMTAIVSGAVSTAFTVLGTAFIAKLYIALRARHEVVAPQ